jgi:hypothetical protein
MPGASAAYPDKGNDLKFQQLSYTWRQKCGCGLGPPQEPQTQKIWLRQYKKKMNITLKIKPIGEKMLN